MCEEETECCIAKHLGCDVSGWAVNDKSSFLRGEGKEVVGGCMPYQAPQSCDGLKVVRAGSGCDLLRASVCCFKPQLNVLTFDWYIHQLYYPMLLHVC